MAGKSGTATALDAYRQRLLSDDVQAKIAELAEAVTSFEAAAARRDNEAAKALAGLWWVDEQKIAALAKVLHDLAADQWAAEDQVLSAFEAAKAAGAKPAVLHDIGLRPDAALSAARQRSKAQQPAGGAPSARGSSTESSQ